MAWGTLLLPILMFKEIVVKIFGQPPQDTEMVEGGDVDDKQDPASDLSIRECSESGKIPI